jgi:BirA family biotin operon repressor/biotin-[acetyl-CoA-carboxylase] ligase
VEYGGRKGAVLTVDIRTIAETGSTNADLIALAANGVAEGFWLRAERQTAGRGRQGRDWISPPGNLYASTLVRLRPTDPAPATLALVAGLALEHAIKFHCAGDNPPDLFLKWPNDVLLYGAKVSGILLERTDDAIVIGFGVNLHHHPDLPQRRTTSLLAHGISVAPEVFIDTLSQVFSDWLARWRRYGLAETRARWLESAHPIGTALRTHMPDGSTIDGLFEGLDADGALILRLADGTARVIHAGDVFLI